MRAIRRVVGKNWIYIMASPKSQHAIYFWKDVMLTWKDGNISSQYSSKSTCISFPTFFFSGRVLWSSLVFCCSVLQECKKILRYDQKILQYGREIVMYEQELVRYDWENESLFIGNNNLYCSSEITLLYQWNSSEVKLKPIQNTNCLISLKYDKKPLKWLSYHPVPFGLKQVHNETYTFQPT